MAAIRVESKLGEWVPIKKVLDRVMHCHLTCSVYTVKHYEYCSRSGGSSNMRYEHKQFEICR